MWPEKLLEGRQSRKEANGRFSRTAAGTRSLPHTLRRLDGEDRGVAECGAQPPCLCVPVSPQHTELRVD